MNLNTPFHEMQQSRGSEATTGFNSFLNQPMQQIDPYGFSKFQVVNNDSNGHRNQGNEVSFQGCSEQFFTLESTPAMDYATYSSPSAVSASSNRSPFSSQGSHSYASDHHHSSENTYGSPLSGSSGVEDENKLMRALWVLKNDLLGPESETDDSGFFNGIVTQPSPFSKYNKVLDMAPHMDLKQLLIACGQIVSEADAIPFPDRQVAISAAEALMEIIEKWVSVSGDPLQRLGAYMLEGLRARLLSSGSIIYKKLKCSEPTSSELMSYMHVIYQICPYYKFAYQSANVIIGEAMEGENNIHVIDFQIAQGSQWVSFIQDLSCRPGRPPYVRITGVDDSQSAHARNGGLEIVGRRLAKVAESCGVPFEFHSAAMSGCEVQLENLQIRHGAALAVNFPYVLHHMPDESVNTMNHRDRLLRLVKGLSPKVVTLLEQESNTNTATFYHRFCETLDYYTAMFESIDAARPRDDRQRISAEEHCVARDVVNIIACEGPERVERHELFGKWRSRLLMAGFSPVQLSPSVGSTITAMLSEHSPNYRLASANGALYLGWKNRALVTCSAWR
ncbi:scarecrow-like protein 13 [Andrographis paniculata]|uniref:scarecrow-like protein 13 n=1 Tax=Andrographis paniculata TaxID=175694 RepID=UPI0021E98EC5|nr:scarecrow-like protein 13 [Andrographis paniculata]